MKTKIVSSRQLQDAQIDEMFLIMRQYYQNVQKDTFLSDLAEKEKVILLFGTDQKIKGFSTILQKKIQVQNRTAMALYSGDTVLHREHWGNGALAMAFGRHLMAMKLRYPLTPVYWFLISKGYKTYLLMTNNFADHYPRYERSTPETYRQAMRVFYGSRFGSSYCPQKGLIQFESNQSAHLKDFIAEITEECRQNPRIAFFETMNPDWKKGVELACVARVTVWVPIAYTLKRFRKVFNAYGKGLEAVYRKQH